MHTFLQSRANEDQRKIFAFYITLNFIHVADVRFERLHGRVLWIHSEAVIPLIWRADAVCSNCSSQYAICTYLHHLALARLVVLNNKLKSDGTWACWVQAKKQLATSAAWHQPLVIPVWSTSGSAVPAYRTNDAPSTAWSNALTSWQWLNFFCLVHVSDHQVNLI